MTSCLGWEYKGPTPNWASPISWTHPIPTFKSTLNCLFYYRRVGFNKHTRIIRWRSVSQNSTLLTNPFSFLYFFSLPFPLHSLVLLVLALVMSPQSNSFHLLVLLASAKGACWARWRSRARAILTHERTNERREALSFFCFSPTR